MVTAVMLFGTRSLVRASRFGCRWCRCRHGGSRLPVIEFQTDFTHHTARSRKIGKGAAHHIRHGGGQTGLTAVAVDPHFIQLAAVGTVGDAQVQLPVVYRESGLLRWSVPERVIERIPAHATPARIARRSVPERIVGRLCDDHGIVLHAVAERHFEPG